MLEHETGYKLFLVQEIIQELPLKVGSVMLQHR